MFVYLSCVRSKKRSFGTRCASTKRKASEGRAFGCSKLSDFYELKTTCSRTIQNAELFLSAGASPLMRERRNKPILRCIGYQFGCSIAQATERHGASLCGIQNRLRIVFHRGEPLFLGNSKKANAERRSAIGLFLAL